MAASEALYAPSTGETPPASIANHASNGPSPATSAANGGMRAALIAWEEEFLLANGRRPKPEEATEMVLGVYATLPPAAK